MKLNLRFKIMSLAGAGLVSAIIIGLVGIVGHQKMSAINNEKETISKALQHHVDGDMMHDAIRADVLNGNLHALKKNLTGVKESEENLIEHAERFRKNVERNLNLPLSPDIMVLLKEISPALENYIASAEAIVRTFGKDLEQGEKKLPEFQRAFVVLEAEQEVLTEKLEEILTAKNIEIEQLADQVTNLQIAVLSVFMFGLFVYAWWVVRSIMRDVGGEPNYAASVVAQIAAGDLTQQINIKQGDTTSILAVIREMSNTLSQVLGEVRTSADALASSSEEVTATAQSLAKGASVQTASVEETSASMDEMLASIMQNNQNAVITDGMAQKAANDAKSGGTAVEGTVEAMQKIADRIGVIDDIAYQTNLLALNAAIEAGRAGEHGRGFAVVASEVRKLAERSQVAAQEIGSLASETVSKADNAGKLLQEMVPAIRKTADLVQEIAAASNEQTEGVNQINAAIGQVSQTMQQNAAAAEELSSTSEELSSQALRLQEAVSYFTLNNQASRTSYSRIQKTNISTSPTPSRKADKKILGDDDLDKNFVRYS